MALQSSGQISMNNINTELGQSPTAQASLNDANYRTLAGVPSGAITMQNFYGKSSYATGLYRSNINSYFADNPYAFGSPASTSVDTGVLSDGGVPEYTSYHWLGYFKPTSTGTHTFWSTSDDASYIWLGAGAISPDAGNALVNVGGLHGDQTGSASISLTAGTYYTFRIATGNNGGPGTSRLYWAGPGQGQTTNFSGMIFYNPTTNGL
jgi:hypothetical protein